MEKIIKVMATTTRLLKERVPIVLAGHEQCRNEGCPEASELREVHCTAGRDGMIISLMDHLSQIIESNRLDPEVAKGMMEAIPIEISENRSVTLYHVYQNHLWLSPHPEDSIEARWGLKKCDMIHAGIRAANNSIFFIDRTYRKKDPKYADFSIRTQQQLLRRLSDEWTRSECGELPITPTIPAIPSPHRKPSVEARLQLKQCERIRAEIRTTNHSIVFIEKTYREKDPEYADFSIRTQQQLLEKLSEEWTSFECGEPPRTPQKKAKN
jgi:hypothetical protein